MICDNCFWTGQCAMQHCIPINELLRLGSCSLKKTIVELKSQSLLPLNYKSKKGLSSDSVTINAGLHV
jgi:hypothetical protein